MKKSKLILSGIILLATCAFTSCSKEEGCTDINATNYNPEAEEDDGSCEFPATGAYLKVNSNMTATLASSGCYATGDVWKVKITSGPVSIAEKTFTVDVNVAAYEGTVTLDGFTQSGTYTFDIIDNYNDVIEGGSNYFSSSEVEDGSTDTVTESISTFDAGC